MDSGTSNRHVNRAVALAAGTAGLVCLLLYLRTLGNDFIYTDDPAYVYNNMQIRSLDRGMLAAAFTQLFAGDYWMPLTWISFAVDYHIWGLNPTGYHLTNSILHAVNAGLVVLIADRLLRERFAVEQELNTAYVPLLLFSGLMWGLHPLRVESVAWVAERKDVLNGMFALGSFLAYACYAKWRENGGARGAGRCYCASLLLFACSLLAKPSSVVLPAVFLIVDRYPLRRLNRSTAVRLLLEKLPFLILAVAVTIITIVAKINYGGMQSMTALPFFVRLVLSGNAVFEYLKMSVWPVGIIFFYPLLKPVPAAFIIKTAAMGLASLMIGFQAWKRPGLAACWFSFLVLLLPVLSFMHNGIDIALAPRFTYLASVAAAIGITAGIAALMRKYAVMRQRAVALLLATVLVWHAGISIKLIGSWKDTETVWNRQIGIFPLGRAYNARGHYHLIRERYPEAIRDFSTALDIAARSGQPFVDNILAFRGEAYRLAGDSATAVADFTAAIDLNPLPRYFYHRGLALRQLGMAAEADKDFLQSGGDSGPIVWFTETDSR